MQLNPSVNVSIPTSAGRSDASNARVCWPESASKPSCVCWRGPTVVWDGDLIGPVKPTVTGRRWPWLLASAALHGVVLATFFVCAMLPDPTLEPPLMVIGSINLSGLGGGEPAGGDGLESGLDGGQGGAAQETVTAPPAKAPSASPVTVAPTEIEPTLAQTTAQTPERLPEPTSQSVPQPQPQPVPELASRTPPPKPQASPKPQATSKPRPQTPVAKEQRSGSPATPPATVAANPLASKGTGDGTSAGDGVGRGLSGEGPGKGLIPGAGAGGNGDGRGDGGLYVGEFGQGDGPKFRHRSPLRYPDAAKRAGQEGKVRLRLDIDAEGVLRNVAVVEHTGLEFVEEALRAIKASTFYPAKRQGRSEACNALLTIRFALG